MKFAYTMLSILVTLLLVSGCSEEKPASIESQDVKKNVARNIVRKSVKQPIKKIKKPEEPKKEPRKEAPDIAKKVPEQKTPQEKSNKETFTAQEPEKKEVTPIEEVEIYITKDGDTLSTISGRADIYNNPLKWPLLYRDNPEALSSIINSDNFYEASLPAGIELEIASEDERKKRIEKEPKNYYVANILSSPYLKEMAPQVIKLIDAGYFAYITTAMIDDKEWYRIRVGFYKTRTEANEVGDEIRTHLKIPDIWTAKIGDIEFHTFSGY